MTTPHVMSNDTIPLPEPDGSVWVGGWVQQGWIGKSMHAHAAAVTAAARDCRTCKHMMHRHFRITCGAEPCTNADRYEPLPPVRLWRPRAASSSA